MVNEKFVLKPQVLRTMSSPTLTETISAYAINRANSTPLPMGSAPHTSSKPFKLAANNPTTNAQRWDHLLSLESSLRGRSTLKAASKISNPAAVISLGTARPAPRYYPWQSVAIGATDAHHTGKDHNDSSIQTACYKGESAYDLGIALNYGFAAGSPQVLRFITEHIEMVHKPLYDDWECSLTCGTTSAIEIILRMLCNRGETVLCEAFTYPGTIEAANGLGLRMIDVGMDSIGLIPDHLESILCNWDVSKNPKPKILYTIPSGQNPTGATQTLERRRKIYEIAEQYDLIILEDDPYYFIQLGAPETNGHHETRLAPIEQYIQKLPSSYLSLDTSGRVLRLDATSKILAPGLRCGWLTGCSQLVSKFIEHTELSTISPSGPSQLLLYKLLDQSWGHEGFFKWLMYLSWEFEQRLQTLLQACKRHLPESVCTWRSPSAGMFIWVKVDCSQHPAASRSCGSREGHKSALDIEDSIYLAAREQGVLVSKGSWFAVDKHASSSVHFRMTFAAAGDGDITTAVERFGRALRAEFNITVTSE